MRKVAFYILLWLMGGEKDMSVIYATLIIYQAKTFCDVPDVIKPQVAQQLTILGVPELAVCEVE